MFVFYRVIGPLKIFLDAGPSKSYSGRDESRGSYIVVSLSVSTYAIVYGSIAYAALLVMN